MALAIAAMTFTACEDVPEPYPMPDPSNNGENTEVEGATGDGSLENPFNSVAANAEAKKLGSGGVSEQYVYIKGKVASIAIDKNDNVLNFDQGTYGNASFYISDDGTSTNQFYCYRVLYLGNKKWTKGSGDILKVGDEVIVCARITLYNTTPETQQNEGYLYSLNGKTERTGGQTPQPASDLGTAEAPITVAKALEIIEGYEAAGASATDAYVKGKIVKVDSYNEKYSSLTYYISDDGTETKQLQVYSGKGLNGAAFASVNDLTVGAVVVVKGQLKKYAAKDGTTTPEINQNSEIISIDGQSGGGGSQGGGGTTTSSLTNGDFETWADGLPTGWKSASTASSATLTQSTDAHGGSFSCNVNGNESQNKRLASQEITLAAGTYVFSFYTKATTSDKSQVRPGYAIVENGTINSSSGYKYGGYVDISTDWTQVTHEFTLDVETTVCLLVMNPKAGSYSSGKDVLVDDATLTKK